MGFAGNGLAPGGAGGRLDWKSSLKPRIRCNTCETHRWGQRPQRNEGHKVRAVFGQDRHQHNKIHVKLKRRSGHKRREESTCSDGKEAMMMRGEDQ